MKFQTIKLIVDPGTSQLLDFSLEEILQTKCCNWQVSMLRVCVMCFVFIHFCFIQLPYSSFLIHSYGKDILGFFPSSNVDGPHPLCLTWEKGREDPSFIGNWNTCAAEKIEASSGHSKKAGCTTEWAQEGIWLPVQGKQHYRVGRGRCLAIPERVDRVTQWAQENVWHPKEADRATQQVLG